MPKNNGRIPDEIKVKILAEPVTESNGAVGRKYGVQEGTVWYIRKQAGIRSAAKMGRPSAGMAAKPVAPARNAAKAPRGAMIPVEIDPQRPGTAAALLGALERIEHGGERYAIQLNLSGAEIVEVICGLSAAQRAAFFSAGLRAAFLA